MSSRARQEGAQAQSRRWIDRGRFSARHRRETRLGLALLGSTRCRRHASPGSRIALAPSHDAAAYAPGPIRMSAVWWAGADRSAARISPRQCEAGRPTGGGPDSPRPGSARRMARRARREHPSSRPTMGRESCPRSCARVELPEVRRRAAHHAPVSRRPWSLRDETPIMPAPPIADDLEQPLSPWRSKREVGSSHHTASLGWHALAISSLGSPRGTG